MRARIVKTPKEFITIYPDDAVHFSFSVIENGVEKVLLTSELWKETVTLATAVSEEKTVSIGLDFEKGTVKQDLAK